MGEVTKARLKKDLRYICLPCLSTLIKNQNQNKTPDYMKRFNDIFSGFGK